MSYLPTIPQYSIFNSTPQLIEYLCLLSGWIVIVLINWICPLFDECVVRRTSEAKKMTNTRIFSFLCIHQRVAQNPKKLRMIFAAPILDLTMSKHARQGVIYERVVPLCSRWISPIPTRARQRLWFNLLVPFLKRRFQRILMISYLVFGYFWAKAVYIKQFNCQLHKQRWLKKATRYFHFLLIFYYHYLLTLVSFHWLLP